MKKFIYLIFFLMIVIPTCVYASNENIEIKSISLEDKSTNAEIIEKPTVQGLKVNYKLKFNVVGDYVEYKIVVKNNNEKDYEITIKNFDENEHIKYSLDANNDALIKGLEEKSFFVKIKYDKKVTDEEYINDEYLLKNDFCLEFLHNESENVEKTTTKANEEITNPQTGIKDYSVVIIGVIICVGIVLYIATKNKKIFKSFILIIGFLACIPWIVKAIEIYKLELKTEVLIQKNTKIYEIIINPNGGLYNEKEDETKIELINGKEYELTLPTRDNYIFSRWEVEGKSSSIYDKKNNKVEINGSNIVLKAIWIKSDDVVAKIKETGTMYESVQSAFDSASNNQTIIQLKDSIENVSNTKKIIYNMNGFTLSGSLMNSGDINIFNGQIKSETIGIENQGTLTLGINDEVVNSYNCKIGEDNGCVEIIGKSQGTSTMTGTFNFYDGFIRGNVGLIGGCNHTPKYGSDEDGTTIFYKAVVDKDASNNEQLVYLSESSKAVSKTKENGEVYYYNLQDNINASILTGYEIFAVRDFEAAYELEIKENAEITFNLAGYEVNTGNDISNLGIFNIRETKDGTGILKASHSIFNENILNLENIKLIGTTVAETINNAGTLNLKNSIVQGTKGYGVKATNSNGSIVMDTTSLITSTENHGLYIDKDITQIIDGGKYESTFNNGNAIYCNSGNLTIKNLEIETTKTAIYLNGGKTTIESGNIKSNEGVGIYNGADLTINGGYIFSKTNYGIENKNKLTINKGKIESENRYGVYNYSYTVVLNGGEIHSLKSYALSNSGGTLTVNGGTLLSDESIALHNVYWFGVWDPHHTHTTINGGNFKSTKSYGLYNDSNITILGGNFSSAESYGAYNKTGTLVIGSNDGTIDIDSPSIKGSTYGLYLAGGNISLYDGILKGKTAGYYGEFNTIVDGTYLFEGKETIENEEYKVNYLRDNINFLEVNGVQYNSFEKALESISNKGTIKVINNAKINYGLNIPKDKEITIDLNSYNLQTTVEIINNGKLNLIDSSTEKKGTLKNIKTKTIQNNYSGELIVESGNYYSDTSGPVIYNSGTTNIKNGTLICEGSNSAIYNSGTTIIENGKFKSEQSYAISNSGTMTINNGEFLSTNSQTIYNSRTLTINNGIFKSQYSNAIGAYYSTTINGGTFTSEKGTTIYNNNYLKVTAGTFQTSGERSQYALENYRGNANIEGGTFISKNNSAIYTSQGTLNIGINRGSIDKINPTIIGGIYGVDINSGTFNFYGGILKGKKNGYNGTISSIADGTIIKDDMEVIDELEYKTNYLSQQAEFLEVNGIKYNSFDKASEAIEEVGTIKVIESIQINFGLTIPKEKNITLDLAGKEIITTTTIQNNGTFTIIDSSTSKNGSLTNNTSKTIQNNSGGIFTLESGNINNTSKDYNGNVLSNSGTATINGGSINASYYYGIYNGNKLFMNGGNVKSITYNGIYNSGEFTMMDGTVYSENTDALSNSRIATINGGEIKSNLRSAISTYNLLTINNGTFISNEYYVLYNNGNATINGGTFKTNGSKGEAYGIYNRSNLNIRGGNIYSPTTYGIYNYEGTTNVGTKNDSIDNSNIIIEGNTYGVYIVKGAFNFYDGIIKGKTGSSYGSVSNVESNSDIVTETETIDNNIYFKSYPEIIKTFIKNTNNGIEYSNLQAAINDANEFDTLIFKRNGNNYQDIVVDASKTITIDFNGFTLTTSKKLTNNGNLSLVNTKDKIKNIIETYSVSLLINNKNLNIHNVTLNATQSNAIENNATLNIDNSKIEGKNNILNNKNGNLIIDNTDFETTDKGIENYGMFTAKNCNFKTSASSYLIYNAPKNSVVSKLLSCTINSSRLTSYTVYNYSYTLEITETNSNSGMTNGSGTNAKIIFDNGDIGYTINNSNELELKNAVINFKEESSSNSKIINNEAKGKMIIKDSNINLVSLYSSNYNVYGLYNIGSMNIENLNINLDNEYGIKYGMYQENGTCTLDEFKTTISGGKTNYGLYIKSGDITLDDGKIDITNTETAYGIYIANGSVTLGKAEDQASEFYGTNHANVSTTNPSIKAIGSKNGIGVKKANGYFNFYDGIIIGSSQAKPDVTSNVEYKYQVETYKDNNNYEYCILEYMKE